MFRSIGISSNSPTDLVLTDFNDLPFGESCVQRILCLVKLHHSIFFLNKLENLFFEYCQISLFHYVSTCSKKHPQIKLIPAMDFIVAGRRLL